MFYQHKEQDTFFYSFDEIFQVIIEIEKYPDFVPWCKAVYIKEKIDNKIVVDLLVDFHGMKEKYTSRVTFFSPSKTNEGWIRTVSSNGIFKYLYNEWRIIPIDLNKTTVKFYIEFEFKSNLLSYMLYSVYNYIQNEIITAFRKRIQGLAKQKLS
ncbi:MAG: type II toxin-antitoxin system RatA family toxin [Wolbachia endosymbiont of Meromenopon meropis]|nr:type II toxin-antitoxin system RatA family toxin [Wolbachia endosymbiont of Meromenopon meropis]